MIEVVMSAADECHTSGSQAWAGQEKLESVNGCGEAFLAGFEYNSSLRMLLKPSVPSLTFLCGMTAVYPGKRVSGLWHSWLPLTVLSAASWIHSAWTGVLPQSFSAHCFSPCLECILICQ